MKSSHLQSDRAWPKWWRFTVIAVAVLALCSCRGVPHAGPQASPSFVGNDEVVIRGQETLPPSAWTGAECPDCAPGSGQSWAPPGISRPWPRDEYLCDGGDKGAQSYVRPNWEIKGLGLEDTIAHYDTLDGRTIVEPSNCVCVYAPRFGAVRKVLGVSGFDVKQGLVLYNVPTSASVEDESLGPNTTLQNLQVEQEINAKIALSQQRNAPSLLVDNRFGLIQSEARERANENFRILRDEAYEQTEEPWLAARIQSAIAWTHDKGVQVILDEKQAFVLKFGSRAQAIFGSEPTGRPKLKICKEASTSAAAPGQIIEFTLRFDNIGSELLGNVTIVDNLTTRLEYVPDSESCTLNADFLTQPNDGDSLVLRWEVIDPLPPGKGGVIRFKCRVR